MLITIQQFTLPAENLADGDYTLRLWYNQGFLDSSGQAVAPGTATTGTQLRSDATVSAGFITFDPFTVYSTLDAQTPNPQAIQISCQLFKRNSSLPIYPFNQISTPSSWIVPDDLGATLSFEEWTIANQRIQLYYAQPDWYTASEVDALIAAAISQGALNQDYVIGDYASFAAAITAITPTGGTLVINQATTTLQTVAVPAIITLRFTEKGSLTVTTGTTLTLAAAPDAAPDQRIFYNANSLASEGTVVITGTVDPIYAAWFGDCVTDLGIPLSSAIATIAAVGGEVKLPRAATSLLTTVDATDIPTQRLKISGYGRGSLISAKTTGLPAFDFTGSQFLELEDIFMTGNSSLTPNVGFLFARIETGTPDDSAGHNHLYNVEIQGNFTIAPLYNFYSEEMRIYDSHFTNNQAGGHAAVFTGDNNFSVTSVYQTIATVPSGQTTIDIATFGCSWENFATSGDSDCLYLRGVSGFSSYSSFFVNGRRAFVHLDSEISNVNVDFKDSRFDAGAEQATYGFLQTGEESSAYVTVEQVFDQGVMPTQAGGEYTAITNAATCAITTTSAHGLTTGQEIVITGALSTLGAAINGPRVVTVTGASTFTIPVNTSALSVYGGTGAYGGGRHYYAESPTVAHPNGSDLLALKFTQYDPATAGAIRPYVFVYSGDNCEIDVSLAGAIESVTNTGVGSPAITRSILQVPIANLILGRPDFCLKNQVFDYTVGGLMVGRRVAAKTTAHTAGGQEVNTLFTNTGAGGSVTFTLPAAAVGMTYEFYRDANFDVVIDPPGVELIRVGTSISTSGGSVTLSAVGSRIRITAVTTTLWIGDLTGTATFA